MDPIKISAQQVKQIVKRRKRLLIIVPLIMVSFSIAAAFLIPPKYHSSISILVQRDQTLNPLIMYEMAVNFASEDRLKSFNEIIYSRATIEMVIDSLNLDTEVTTNYEKQELVKKTQKNIGTSFKSSDSFDIIFFDAEPARAQAGVALLANHFIKTRLSFENKRNEQTVEFFESKLEELEEEVNQRRNTILELTRARVQEMPIDNSTAIQSQLQSLDREIEMLDQDINRYIGILSVFEEISSAPLPLSGQDVQKLYTLQNSELPYGDDLRSALRNYDDFLQKFTREYPTYKQYENKVLEVIARIPAVVKAEMAAKQLKRTDFSGQRIQLITNLEHTYVSSRMTEGEESDYHIYQGLYNDMKVKLEQARTTRDLGRKATNQFIVIDPPFYPEKPTTPNRPLLILGGLFAGFILGIIGAATAEIFDTTIRQKDDLTDFGIPIIAFISDGGSK